MRSFLFVPADSPRKLEKAMTSGADALIVDLEDSIAHDGKERARKSAAGLRLNADGRAIAVMFHQHGFHFVSVVQLE